MLSENINDVYKRLLRSKERADTRANNLRNRKNNLSNHGYWSLGYFEGVSYELDNVLDMLDKLYSKDIEKDAKSMDKLTIDGIFMSLKAMLWPKIS